MGIIRILSSVRCILCLLVSLTIALTFNPTNRRAFLSKATATILSTSPFFTTYDSNAATVVATTGGSAEEDYEVAATWIRSRFNSSLSRDKTLSGPLLRLAFHDAATLEDGPSSTRTGGPNGSIRFELEDRNENRALRRPLEVVKQIHEEYNRDVASSAKKVSLSDTIALAGATAVEYAGGTHIAILMGRIDTDSADPINLRKPLFKTTERSKVDRTLPSPALDSDGLRLYFARLGLTEEEFVALSGSHGLGRHVSLLGMQKNCLKDLTRECLENAPVLLPFVTEGVDTFSNSYFKYLLRWYDREVEVGEVAFIPTDVALVVDKGLRRHVKRFAANEDDFFKTFQRAYQKLVDSTATSRNRY